MLGDPDFKKSKAGQELAAKGVALDFLQDQLKLMQVKNRGQSYDAKGGTKSSTPGPQDISLGGDKELNLL